MLKDKLRRSHMISKSRYINANRGKTGTPCSSSEGYKGRRAYNRSVDVSNNPLQSKT